MRLQCDGNTLMSQQKHKLLAVPTVTIWSFLKKEFNKIRCLNEFG